MQQLSQPELVATLAAPEELDGLEPYLERVGWLEVRADLADELDTVIDAEWLRSRVPCRLLYTLRSVDEGGAFAGGAEERARRLATADSYDLVDLEAERDLGSGLLDSIPQERRLLSWHGRPESVGSLSRRLESMRQTPARYYKLISMVDENGQEVPSIELLEQAAEHRRGSQNVVSFAAGDVGVWTRIVSARLGSPLVYGSCAERPAAPGQPSIARLVADYDLPFLRSADHTFGIAGCPVAQSLSPRLHNGAYRDIDLPAQFLPFHAATLPGLWNGLVKADLFDRIGMPIRGLSVTSPHKEAALEIADSADPGAREIRSANTLVPGPVGWHATTTDPEGVLGPLRLRDVPLEAPALVVGCGGAGRAAALGLRDAGAAVTLCNRSIVRGEEAARLLSLPFAALSDVDLERFRIVVHATSLGHAPADPLAFDPERLRQDAVVVDMVYDREETPLVTRSRQLGLTAIDGVEVLLHQAVEQFRRMTDRVLPIDSAARRLRGELISEARV